MASERQKQVTTKQTLESVLSLYEEQVLDSGVLCHAESQEHLEGYRGLFAFLASRGKNHTDYRMYASRTRVKGILSGGALYLTDGSSWNDKFDRERFNPSFMGTKRFGACFSASPSESIAMWMLYGGVKGNGAMIDFDRDTLLEAMGKDSYECGYFDSDGHFECRAVLPSGKLDLKLVDVLYFEGREDGAVAVGRPSRKEKWKVLDRRAFNGITEITKHRSWSYEDEVRLVATVSKFDLGGRPSDITCIKIPIVTEGDFASKRVFDSPICDEHGVYLESELRGTVDWNLCAGCGKNDK